jgi:predicted RNA-binding protein with RPS1 domain
MQLLYNAIYADKLVCITVTLHVCTTLSACWSTQVGDLVTGVVTSIQPYGAFIDAGGVSGLLPTGQISKALVESVPDVFSVGDQVKVLVLNIDPDTGRITFSTRKLEGAPGDMLTDRQAVFDGAEAMAARWRELQAIRWAASAPPVAGSGTPPASLHTGWVTQVTCWQVQCSG